MNEQERRLAEQGEQAPERWPNDLIAFKWAETLSQGEQSVLLTGSLQRLQERINAALTLQPPATGERCVNCGHDDALQRSADGTCNELSETGNDQRCGCKCVFATTGAGEGRLRLHWPFSVRRPNCAECDREYEPPPTTVDALSDAPTAASVVEAAQGEQHPIEVIIQQWRNALSPDSTVTDEDAEDLLLRLLAKRGVPPGTPIPSDAARERGGAAWLLPQIQRRLQVVLDCEGGMCTHCIDVLSADVFPMVQRAIELTLPPTEATADERKTIASENSHLFRLKCDEVERLRESEQFWRIDALGHFCSDCSQGDKRQVAFHCARCGGPMVWKKDEGRKTYKQLQDELATARAHAIRDAIAEVQEMRAGSLWHADGYDTAASGLLDRLERLATTQPGERVE